MACFNDSMSVLVRGVDYRIEKVTGEEERRRKMSEVFYDSKTPVLPPSDGREIEEKLIAVMIPHGDLDEAFRLRHDFVVKRKRWLPDDGSGVELDTHDRKAHHFGVYGPFMDERKLLVYARIKPGGFQEMMLNKEFLPIIPDPKKLEERICPNKSAEISRLVAQRDLPKDLKDIAFRHLYRTMVGWATNQKPPRPFWYATITRRLYEKYATYGFQMEVLTSGHFMAGGEETLIIEIDLEKTHYFMLHSMPDDYTFYFGSNGFRLFENGGNGNGNNGHR